MTKTKRTKDTELLGYLSRKLDECQLSGRSRSEGKLDLDHLVPKGPPHFGDDVEENVMAIDHTLHMEKHGGTVSDSVRRMQRHFMTKAQLDYIETKKGREWLDRRYPLPRAREIQALLELNVGVEPAEVVNRLRKHA